MPIIVSVIAKALAFVDYFLGLFATVNATPVTGLAGNCGMSISVYNATVTECGMAIAQSLAGLSDLGLKLAGVMMAGLLTV
jgi:hypothetical protein